MKGIESRRSKKVKGFINSLVLEELDRLKLQYQTGEIDLDRLIDLSYQVGTKDSDKDSSM